MQVSEKLKTAIINVNKALHTIEETSKILHEAVFTNEFSCSEDWSAMEIESFCCDLIKSAKEAARNNGYYYW